MNQDKLVRLLTGLMADGRLPTAITRDALRELGIPSDAPFSSTELLDTLESITGEGIARLAEKIREERRRQTILHFEARRAGQTPPPLPFLPPELSMEPIPIWEPSNRFARRLARALPILRDWYFLQRYDDQLPLITRKVLSAWHASLEELRKDKTSWLQLDISSIALEAAEAIRDGTPDLSNDLERLAVEQSQFREEGLLETPASLFGKASEEENNLRQIVTGFGSAATRREKRRLIGQLCRWPSDRAADSILETAREGWAQEEALLNLTLRFGADQFRNWEQCAQWLRSSSSGAMPSRDEFAFSLKPPHFEILFTFCSACGIEAGTLLDRLAQYCGNRVVEMRPEEFIKRWDSQLVADERRILTENAVVSEAVEEAAEIFPVETVVTSAEIGPLQPPLSESIKPTTPFPGEASTSPMRVSSARIHVAPSQVAHFWETHVQPFFLANWYLVAGVLMVIVGSSLLAYFTWDKHWLLRYTIMPILLGGFTIAMAQAGSWIEKKDAQLKGMATTVRGAAICLLPVNFMVLPLLADDPEVVHPLPAVAVMAAIYLSLFGFFLKRWCRAVHASLAGLEARPLLLFNMLVLLAPLSKLWGGALFDPCVAGFYTGFAALIWTTFRFNRDVLTRELAAEERVPWFFGITLTLTFLQTFAWVHGILVNAPAAATYAPMVILGGWLLLVVERRTLALEHSSVLHRSESFLGFAMVLLGIMMAAGHPLLRIACFLLAGGVWLFQALARGHILHYWISLLLLLMGGASIGILPEYPGPWLGALGVALSLWMAGLARLGKHQGEEKLGEVASDLMMTTLIFSIIVAVLAQWHFQSEPLVTAGILALIAALMIGHALRRELSRWLVIGMTTLALCLPYLGCVDLTGLTLHGNSMVFGLGILSFLWLAAVGRSSSRLAPRSRSTVLWIYGALALAAMVLRIVIERSPVEAPTAGRVIMDFAGPFLMTAALVFASWFSRSLAPGVFAGLILAVLFPMMRADVESLMHVSWGSGLGGAVSALLIVSLSFILRPWKRLAHPGDGDRLFGDLPFPFRRDDHSLFTWPLLASAFFLAAKVILWNVPRNFSSLGLGYRTSCALIVLAAYWTLLAIYNGRRTLAFLGTHIGWICLLAGITTAYYSQSANPRWQDPLLLFGCIMQGLYWVHRYVLEPRWPWIRDVATEPTQIVLRGGSLLGAAAIIMKLCAGKSSSDLALFAAFIAAQLIWHAVRDRLATHGILLTLLAWTIILEATAPGAPRPLLGRLSFESSLLPTLWWLLGIELLHVGLEARPEWHARLAALFKPMHAFALLATTVLGVIGVVEVPAICDLEQSRLLFILLVLLLTSRSRASGPLALLAATLAALIIQHAELSGYASAGDRLSLLGTPWRLAAFALALATMGAIERRARRDWPAVIGGRYPSFAMTWNVSGWFMTAAGLLALYAELRHLAWTSFRDSGAQLPVPYLGAAAFAIVAWSTRWRTFFIPSGILFTVGNIHLVRVTLGESLKASGLGELHLVCLGLAVTLIVLSGLRRLPALASAVAALNRASLILAGVILALLPANYFAAPDLEEFTPLRFVVSGVMALLAGLHFRRASRHPGPGEEEITEICESLHHLGVTVAIWCAALLVPALREPSTALIALGLPILFFYARAEWGFALPERSRLTAATLAFTVLGLYIFRFAFQMILFPETPIETDDYHVNSWIILVTGIVMMRLHGLGGTWWLAFYGGISILAGSYFALTALPGLSPFIDPIPAAWCAIGLAHFWTLLTANRSPLRAGLQRLAALNDDAWHEVRRPWGLCLLLAAQAATFIGVADSGADTFAVAPLLLGAASIFLHHGALRRNAWYFVAGGLEIMLALHMDFLTPSYLPAERVVWALIGLWSVGLAISSARPGWLDRGDMTILAGVFAPFTFAHVLYHGPSTSKSLVAMILLALLTALTPRKNRQPGSLLNSLVVLALLAVPTWLIFFSQKSGIGIGSFFSPWSIMSGVATIYATGIFGYHYRRRLHVSYEGLMRTRPCVADHLLSWLGTHGTTLNTVTLWTSFGAALLIQLLHYGAPFADRTLMLLVLLLGAQAVSWHGEGRSRGTMAPFFLLQVALFAIFAALRRHLLLTTNFWSIEYDIWTSLAVSFALTGAKDAFDLEPRQIRTPLAGTLWLMPFVAICWTLVHQLGSNVAMMVVGLHGLMFAWMGRRERNSPYNFVAVIGFVSFIIVAFWSKLGLRVLPAYVVPVGLGVLILLQLFRDAASSTVRNQVRLVTVLAMLGSAGYHALADQRYPIAFNLTMLVLCLAAMGMGGLLRIRLYLVLGFAGIVVDLVSIMVKATMRMERNEQMTAVGATVLIGGIVLVVGAVLYRTHQSEIQARLTRWRERFKGWE